MGPPSLVWMLRQSLLHLWGLEEQHRGNSNDPDAQDALCYALGRRGALGALHGIGLPAQRKRIAMVYLALGYLHANERFEHLSDELFLNRALKQEIATVLAEQFALSAEESAETVQSFASDIGKRQYATYGLGERDDTPIVLDQPASVKEIIEAMHVQRKERDQRWSEMSGLELEDEDVDDAIDRDGEVLLFYQQDIEKRRSALYGLGEQDDTPEA